MGRLFVEHRGFWSHRNKISLYLGILLLILSLVVQIGAGRYSSRSAISANFVGDLFLDNLPIINLDFVIVFCALIFWVAAFVFLAFKPRHLLFGLKAIALFVIFRAFFVSLTHIGIYPKQITIGTGDVGYTLYKLFTFQGNYFFSGHTGFPFLMALIFWRNKFWKRIFILATFFFAASVILAHVHYSIDVFAAPFITYGIFKITQRFFPRDYALIAAEHQRSLTPTP
jgi:hypothetical protein